MATKEDNKKSPEQGATDAASDPIETDADASLQPIAGQGEGTGDEVVEFDTAAPTQLGTDRYVHAAFLAAGLGIAYLTTKILASIWNSLAANASAVRAIPALLNYAEDERENLMLIVGAVVGIVAVIWLLRKSGIRQWADEVANELYKVHWPDRDTVTNGTVVVLAGGVFATVYIALLDRLWSFITNLVYGI
jgi:preprotein translocase SecE subunit